MGRKKSPNVLLFVGIIALVLGIVLMSLPTVVEDTTTQYVQDDTYTMNAKFTNDGTVVSSGAVQNADGNIVDGVLVTISWVVNGEYIDWSTFTVSGNVKAYQKSWDHDRYTTQEIDAEQVSSSSRATDGSGSVEITLSLESLDERNYYNEADESYVVIISCTVYFDVRDMDYKSMETVKFEDSLSFTLNEHSGTWTVNPKIVGVASAFGGATTGSIGLISMVAGGVLIFISILPKKRGR